MRLRYTIALLSALAGAVVSLPAMAQDAASQSYQQQRAAQRARDNFREQMNENVLFLMGGHIGDSYTTLADDISTVTNDGLRLRVLPVMGNAAVQNVSDVLFLRGIDLSLTMVQVINHLKQTKQYGAIDQSLVYIAPLTDDEMHVVGAPGINSIDDLKGKRVNFNIPGSATALLGPRIFQTLKIDVQPVFMNQADAQLRMRNGEIAATVIFSAKPIDAMSRIRGDSGFKLLDVPYASALQEEYLPSSLGNEDYPNLIAKGDKVETIATTTVLVSFNWPRGTPRFNRTAKFVENLFAKFSELQRPPRHPAWKSVNLAATVNGLQRFAPAQEWLERNEPSVAVSSNARKQLMQGAAAKQGGAGDTESLFREFMDFTRNTRR